MQGNTGTTGNKGLFVPGARSRAQRAIQVGDFELDVRRRRRRSEPMTTGGQQATRWLTILRFPGRRRPGATADRRTPRTSDWRLSWTPSSALTSAST